MRVDESEGNIVFDNLTSVERPFGSNEKITAAAPAEMAVACNAKGMFADKTIVEINNSAREFSESLSKALTA